MTLSSQQPTPTLLLAHFLFLGGRGKNAERGICSLFPIVRHLSGFFFESWSSAHNSFLERQTPVTLNVFPLPPPFFQLLLMSTTSYGYRICLFSVGVRCSSCVLSHVLVHTQLTHFWVGGVKRDRKS